MFETIQKSADWRSKLSLIPKIATTVILLLICFVILYIVWTLGRSPTDDPAVKVAYNRMQRVLARIQMRSSGKIYVDGKPVPDRLQDYYKNYVAISQQI
jgi:hypothetical protein